MKNIVLFSIALISVSCSALLKVPTANITDNLYNYQYVYVIPTSGVTSSSGVYGGQYGVYGGVTKTVNPSEVISGYLMKKGYSILPSIAPELSEKTMIVSYGYTGKRRLSLFSYASCIIIQIRNAKNNNLIASCEAEGCASDESGDILQAINSGLNKIFAQ